MIQRIQTIFLFIVIILQTLLFCLPFGQSFQENVVTVISITNYPVLLILAGITSVMAAVAIFLYKNRMLQVRITIFNTILLLALGAYLGYTLYSIEIGYSLKLPVVFPVISAILSALAARSILKDELLIRASNRMR